MLSPSDQGHPNRRCDNDNPFEKYRSQHGNIASGSNPQFLAFMSWKRNPNRVKLLRWAGIICVLVCLLVFWSDPPGFFSSREEIGTMKGEVEVDGKTNFMGPVKDKNSVLEGVSTGKKQVGKEKASLVMLVRNRELTDALTSMKQIEERFNRHYKYPWTFLNDEPFTEEFKKYTTKMASGITEYGVIPKEQWSMPEWISEEKFQQTIVRMTAEKVIYGDSRSYRHMCRYNSGFFWRHESLIKYDWYWRVEPNIDFYCDVTYDPFTFMRENGYKYSFVIGMPEYKSTIETLWPATQEFAKLHPEFIALNNSLGFITDDSEKGIQGSDYNMCHFWSNFEIASLNFWRSEAYSKYFDFLDRKGGFYYERWGDAPVHSIAAALFLNKDQIHFFHDFGYKHVPWGRCPADQESHAYARCVCPDQIRRESFDFHQYGCTKRWWTFAGLNENTGQPIRPS